MVTTIQQLLIGSLELGSEANSVDFEEHCRRCGGNMISDRCLDVASDTGEVGIEVRRCIQCGDVIDPTIIRNRLLQAAGQPVTHQGRKYSKQFFIEGLTEQEANKQKPARLPSEVSL